MDRAGSFRRFPRRALGVQSSDADYHMNCPKLPCFLVILFCLALITSALNASLVNVATDWNSAAPASAEDELNSPAPASVGDESGSTALTDAPPLTISRSQGQ